MGQGGLTAMDITEFAESCAESALDEAKATYDGFHERVHKLVALLVAGAGGAGVYALGKMGPQSALMQVIPLGALSCWWLLIAGLLLLHGASSLEMTPGSTSAAVAEHFNRHFRALESDQAEAQALLKTRWDQLAAVDCQILAYCAGVTQRAKALDKAYLAVVFSPLIVALALLLAYRLQ